MISPITYVFVTLMIVYLLAIILSIVTFCSHHKDRQAQLKATRSQDSGVDINVNDISV